MWNKLHTYWSEIVPPAVYLLLFLLLSTTIFDVDMTKLFDRTALSQWLIETSKNDFYVIAKDLEVTKLIPIAIALIFLLSVFVFFRIAIFVGQIVPPTITYVGDPEIFIDRDLLRTFWMEDPSISDVRNIEHKAQSILDEEAVRGVKLSDARFEDLDLNEGRAYRLSCYGKLGAIWFSSLFAFAPLTHGFTLIRTGTLSALLVGCVALILYSIFWQAKSHLATVEATISEAVNVLIKQPKSYPGDSGEKRLEEFEESYQNAVEKASKFVVLKWGVPPEFEKYRRMFIGKTPNKSVESDA